jgi:hypothetical protein
VVGDKSSAPEKKVIKYEMDSENKFNTFFRNVDSENANIAIVGYAGSCVTTGSAP